MSISSISHETYIINAIINAADRSKSPGHDQRLGHSRSVPISILCLHIPHTQLPFFYTDKTLYDDEQLNLVSSQE